MFDAIKRKIAGLFRRAKQTTQRAKEDTKGQLNSVMAVILLIAGAMIGFLVVSEIANSVDTSSMSSDEQTQFNNTRTRGARALGILGLASIIIGFSVVLTYLRAGGGSAGV